MRKTILTILTLLSLTLLNSCDTKTVYVDKETGNPIYAPNTVLVNGKSYSDFETARAIKLVDITVNGETHQYLRYKTYEYWGYTHWEGCKYCKEKTINNNKEITTL